jgi:hypothetical protein
VNALLRQIADAMSARSGDFAGGGLYDTSNAFHEGGFPRTIVSCKRNAFAWLHGERQIIEEHARAVFDTKTLDGKHEISIGKLIGQKGVVNSEKSHTADDKKK